MLNLVNAWRAQHGVSPALVLDGILIAAAETKSEDMARTGQLSHTIDGVTARQNLTNHGYPTNVSWGENLAWGQTTAQAAFTWWKNSQTHNANMLNGNFRALGVGLEERVGNAIPVLLDADVRFGDRRSGRGVLTWLTGAGAAPAARR